MPKYTNFEDGARNFLVKVLQKVPKNACFFQNLPAAQQIWSKWNLYSDLGELRKLF